ncbi:MAG: hypothetical protein ABFC96_04235 [Thermoguttaceae bacterium]
MMAQQLLDGWTVLAHNGLASLAVADPMDGRMERFWRLRPEQLVLSVAILAVLITVAWYVIGQVRPKKPAKKEPPASQWLSKCRESNSRGELTDDEFRTIKTTLATQLQDELKDNDDEG